MCAASKKKFSTPSECPVCGADVPSNARACPECGADERTGWNEDDTHYDGVDIPESAFEEDSAANEKVESIRQRSNRVALHWWIVAFVLLAVFVARALYLWWF